MEKEVTIKFEKGRLLNNLIMGIFGIIMSIVWYFTLEDLFLVPITWFVLGAIQIMCYYIERKNQYLSISKNRIRRTTLFFSKSLKITEIKKVLKFRHSYVFETDSRKLRVDKQIIDKNSIQDLHLFLDQLPLN